MTPRARSEEAPQIRPNLSTGKRAALYARVSTKKDEQENALGASIERLEDYARARGFRVEHVLKDRLSGTVAADRKDYQRLRDLVRKRLVDVVVSTKLDRIARSLKELMAFFEEARHVGVEIILVDQSIDTGSATGELLFQVLGAVAQFESALIRDRIARGLETARHRGHHLGRPRKHDDLVPVVRALFADKRSLRQISAYLAGEGHKVSRTWVARALARNVAPSRGVGTAGSDAPTSCGTDRPDSGPRSAP